MPKYNYTIARSYHPVAIKNDKEVIALLEKGYEFVRASEFIPAEYDKAGYIEYVLRIADEETDEEKEKLKADVEYWRGLASSYEGTINKLNQAIADNTEAWKKLKNYLGSRMERAALIQCDITQLEASKHCAYEIANELKRIIKKVIECEGGKTE